MNTSKQVNVMIGLLFLAFLAFGAYILNEPNRSATAEEAQNELLAHRGAELFVNNCRSCHGIDGLGPEEGGIGPVLNSPSFLILEEGNEYGVPATPEGEARNIRTFLFNTIACGRKGTAMPLWSERYGGPLSETQINYLVDMIVTGRWDLVEEIGLEHDEHSLEVKQAEEPNLTLEQYQDSLVVKDATTLQLTASNCGQYDGLTALPFRTRSDPRVAGGGGGTAEPGGTGEPGGGGPADAIVQGIPVGDFFQASCAACHGAQRQGAVGPALTPDRLTESDEFYHDTIANGRPGTAMPAWSAAGLTDEEIDALVQFIKNVEP